MMLFPGKVALLGSRIVSTSFGPRYFFSTTLLLVHYVMFFQLGALDMTYRSQLLATALTRHSASARYDN